MNYLTILFARRQHLLGHPNLPRLCALAPRVRNRLALLCVAHFLLALAVVIGYRALPFHWVPVILGIAAIGFVSTAMLASRFGRLCDIEKHPEYAARAAHLVTLHADCASYYDAIRQQGRPFTRLDLEEMGKIYLQRNKNTHLHH